METKVNHRVNVQVLIFGLNPERLPAIKAALALHWPFRGWLGVEPTDPRYYSAVSAMKCSSEEAAYSLVGEGSGTLYDGDTDTALAARLFNALKLANQDDCHAHVLYAEEFQLPSWHCNCSCGGPSLELR